jgi:hypothetical protein
VTFDGFPGFKGVARFVFNLSFTEGRLVLMGLTVVAFVIGHTFFRRA